MSREKQIEEMAKDLRMLDCSQYNPNYSIEYQRAIGLYSLGYRKATDLAAEIFAEIAKILQHHDMLAERDKSEYGELIVMDIGCAIAELKKKYTEGGE